MSEEGFNDPFSEEAMRELLGNQGRPSVSAAVAKLTQALWEFSGGAMNAQIGDARTLGFTVSIELEDTDGNRWMRHFFVGGDGRMLPPWTANGYLRDALSYNENLYSMMAVELQSSGEPEEDDSDD